MTSSNAVNSWLRYKFRKSKSQTMTACGVGKLIIANPQFLLLLERKDSTIHTTATSNKQGTTWALGPCPIFSPLILWSLNHYPPMVAHQVAPFAWQMLSFPRGFSVDSLSILFVCPAWREPGVPKRKRNGIVTMKKLFGGRSRRCKHQLIVLQQKEK